MNPRTGQSRKRLERRFRSRGLAPAKGLALVVRRYMHSRQSTRRATPSTGICAALCGFESSRGTQQLGTRPRAIECSQKRHDVGLLIAREVAVEVLALAFEGRRVATARKKRNHVGK